MREKEKVIYIRCSDRVYRAFKTFVASRGFRDYEGALEWLLAKASREWLPERVY